MIRWIVNHSSMGKTMSDYEQWEVAEEMIRGVKYYAVRTFEVIMVGIIIFCLIFLCGVAGAASAKSRQVEEYLGHCVASSYTAASNTPSGTHTTSSGVRASEGTTIAVDMHNPRVPMGSKVKLVWSENGKKKSHIYTVQDCGNFGWCNNGTRWFDVFFENTGWGLKEVDAYLIRPETKAEKAKRLRKKAERQRKKRKKEQLKEFTLKYSPKLLPWQIVTDKDIIPSGTCIMGWSLLEWQYLDVVGTKKGIGHAIYIGDWKKVQSNRKIRFTEVIEEAVG